jgi:glutaredoxin
VTDTYHIYTQPDCIFCLKAKELLDSLNLPYEEHDISTNENSRRYFKLRGFKTVPQIFESGRHIGGYVQLEAHLTGKIASHDL